MKLCRARVRRLGRQGKRIRSRVRCVEGRRLRITRRFGGIRRGVATRRRRRRDLRSRGHVLMENRSVRAQLNFLLSLGAHKRRLAAVLRQTRGGRRRRSRHVGGLFLTLRSVGTRVGTLRKRLRVRRGDVVNASDCGLRRHTVSLGDGGRVLADTLLL